MMTIEPTGQILGATVRGVDLAKPLDEADFSTILVALGRHGVLCFPDQQLDAAALRDFSQRFGSIQHMLSGFHEPDMPEVGILSNVVENGRPIGLADAGQDWHTDMSYNPTIGFLNVLYAVKVPRRDGRVLGATAFVNTQAAYEELSSDVKTRLAAAPGQHARADDRGAAPEAAALRAPGLSDPSDHRAAGSLLQSRVRDPHQRARRGRERAHPGDAVRPSAPAEIPVHASLDGAGCTGLGPHRHAAQRHRRLRAGRAPPDEALPGDGRQDLRPGLPARARFLTGITGGGQPMRYSRISADCHIDMPWLPPDLFTSNASAAMKDRMPYVTDGPDG